MSDPEKFTIMLTQAELDVVRHALGRMLDPKPVRAKKITQSVSPSFNTGNDALDAFMRCHWSQTDRVAAAKRAKPPCNPDKYPFGLPKRMNADGRRDAETYKYSAVVVRS